MINIEIIQSISAALGYCATPTAQVHSSPDNDHKSVHTLGNVQKLCVFCVVNLLCNFAAYNIVML